MTSIIQLPVGGTLDSIHVDDASRASLVFAKTYDPNIFEIFKNREDGKTGLVKRSSLETAIINTFDLQADRTPPNG